MRYRVFRADALRLSLFCLGLCLLLGVLAGAGKFSVLGKEVFSSEGSPAVDETALCLDLLHSFGWEVLESPTKKEITVPLVFDTVYTRYNEQVELPNGYDLRRFSGEQVTLYTFEVLNYPTEDSVNANVLVKDGVIVGGDVCSVRLDGFMHGFQMPDGVAVPSLAETAGE